MRFFKPGSLMTIVRPIAKGLALVLILAGLTATIVPHYLDRLYYEGPERAAIMTVRVSSTLMAMPTPCGCRRAAGAAAFCGAN